MFLFGKRSIHHHFDDKGGKSFDFGEKWDNPEDMPRITSPYPEVSDLFYVNFSTGSAILHLVVHMKKDGAAVVTMGAGSDDGLGRMGRGLDDQAWDHLRSKNPFIQRMREKYNGVPVPYWMHAPLEFKLKDANDVAAFLRDMDGQYGLSGETPN